MSGVEVDYCPVCLGTWFDEDELRQAKDSKDKNLNWLDIDLWEDKTKINDLMGNCKEIIDITKEIIFN